MNWKRIAGLMCACALIAVLTDVRIVALATEAEARAASDSAAGFFPVSVWYSGGKARAPMLEQINDNSARLWKEDLLKIKGLGFNTVRTWVEWNVGEPREGSHTEGDCASVRGLGAGMGGHEISGRTIRGAG